MRFEKENYFIEITYGISSDADKLNKPVYFVETNLSWDDLPVDMKVQILKDDIEGLEKLKKAVKNLASREGFMLISI
ncbi:MAG: hypothetical protein BV456_06985 [Thermoplasmata archaeon M8B2D]|nr:MAG: hypothetical protein BV456_06985 [Thermoplasmata archaeon M8B2D]